MLWSLISINFPELENPSTSHHFANVVELPSLELSTVRAKDNFHIFAQQEERIDRFSEVIDGEPGQFFVSAEFLVNLTRGLLHLSETPCDLVARPVVRHDVLLAHDHPTSNANGWLSFVNLRLCHIFEVSQKLYHLLESCRFSSCPANFT